MTSLFIFYKKEKLKGKENSLFLKNEIFTDTDYLKPKQNKY